ncbi:hypothetical protein OHA72_46155 [Dactylosporangium sp. NBC_01737]|uniref:hypothetical protein n=1 Tax=Dactylosporangium sp. NBC_01737 TaxID=2975959 RepID=UPI002E0D9B2F|nr:hypothetical protein OHA72_46155 [Dactylosporangium sp. NBC_01737]
MSTNVSGAAARQSFGPRDLPALIGILAVIEGELMGGEVSPRLSARIRDRLERAGVLESGATERDLRQSINDLNHRLRHALGEYEQQPAPLEVPESSGG